jgi:excisionase family DNA binding protein
VAMDTVNNTRLIKPKDAAGYLAISERKLWAMTKGGTIPAVRLGRSVRYDVTDLDELIQQAKMEGNNGQ